MRLRRPWLELLILLALAAGAAVWWRGAPPEEPAGEGAWGWAVAWEVTLEEPVTALVCADLDASSVPEGVAACGEQRFFLLREGRAMDLTTHPSLGSGRGPDGRRLHALVGPTLTVRTSDGVVLWTKDIPFGEDVLSRWADLDGDGVDDLVVADGDEERLAAYDGRDGTERWSRELGVTDLAAVPADASGPGMVYVSDDFGVLWRFSAHGEKTQQRAMEAGAVAASRMDARGTVQFVTEVEDPTYAMFGPGSISRLEARSGDGRFLWSLRDGQEGTGPRFLRIPQIRALAGDLDANGTREWVVRDRPERLVVRSAAGSHVTALVLEPEQEWTVVERPGAAALVLTSRDRTVTARELRKE